VRVSTKPRNGRRLKLIGATALGLDALLFLGGAVVVAAVEGYDGTIFVPLVVMCILGYFGWLGLRSPGTGGRLPIAPRIHRLLFLGSRRSPQWGFLGLVLALSDPLVVHSAHRCDPLSHR
jgi:hypothetical protein